MSESVGMNPNVVYRDGDYVVTFDEALFVSGFNVYKHLKDDLWEKANPRMSFFSSLDAAKDFIKEKKARRIDH